MAAPKNNKHNEKWNLKKANTFLEEVYNYVKLNDDCNSLTKAAINCGEYETVIYYIKDNVIDVDFEPIKKAKDIIKYRLLDNGLTNKYNPTMSIFILKNNHDMKDKSETESNTTLIWKEEKTYE